MRARESGKLPHAWIIGGGRGIGKATLAYHFARMLLADSLTPSLTLPLAGGDKKGFSLAEERNSGVFRRIAAGSHTDLLVIEPAYDEKKEETKREITVEEARRIGEFLALTPGESDWRVVIIDSADDLNTNAANAILKILEEPPARAVLLLISHNPGKLLPTIRSRCRRLQLKPLSEQEYKQVMRIAAPDLKEAQLQQLGEMSNWSPGMACEYHTRGALEWYDKLIALLKTPDALSLHRFCDSFSGKQSHANWRMVTQLILHLLAQLAAGEKGRTPEEEDCLQWLRPIRGRAAWAALWERAQAQFSLAERAHLDYKTALMVFFEQLRLKNAA